MEDGVRNNKKISKSCSMPPEAIETQMQMQQTQMQMQQTQMQMQQTQYDVCDKLTTILNYTF